MAYAILRFQKHKGGASKALCAHHERTKERYESNPDIDPRRTDQNFHLVTPRWNYTREIRHRIQAAGCRVRRDSVKFVDTLVAISPEFAQDHPQEMPDFFRQAFAFLSERLGEENIFSAVVHMDEKTPHMHLCFVPLTRDHRLSAKEILGNQKKLIRWQDDFYAHMAQRWPELERGTPAVETRRKHLSTQWFKKTTAMDQKLDRLEQALSDLTIFNAGKKRAEAIRLLSELLPDLESFQGEAQRMLQRQADYEATQQRLQAENTRLQRHISDQQREESSLRRQLLSLQARCTRAEAALSRLPPEVRAQIQHVKKKNTPER